MLNKYMEMFNTQLTKSMKVKPVLLNLREGKQPYACFKSRPTLAHYWSTSNKLLDDLLEQDIIGYAGDQRSEWCAPAHYVEKPNMGPFTLRLGVDLTRLNSCLIIDQPKVFPTREEIRQQLGSKCKVWTTSDTLAAYYQIKVGQAHDNLHAPQRQVLFQEHSHWEKAELGLLAQGQ